MFKRLITAVVLTLLVSTTAFAEHKLLATDVPDPGSVEALLDFTYSKGSGKNNLDDKVTDEKTGAALSIGAGVVSGLKLSATIPYTIKQHRDGVEIDGVEDITLGARYALTKSLVKLPFDIAVGFDWRIDSASSRDGKPGSGSNNYSPYIAVSKNHPLLIPYLKYQAEFVDKAEGDQIVHNLTVGTEIELSHHYSLDVAVKGVVNGHHEGLKSSADFEIEIAPYINLTKNLYLLPRVAYKDIGDVKDDAGVKILKNADEYKVGLGVYYLF